MTKLTSVAQNYGGNTLTLYMWGLVNPASGTNSVVITASTSGTITGGSISFTGAVQSGLPDNVGTNTGTNVASVSLTPVANFTAGLMFYYNGGGSNNVSNNGGCTVVSTASTTNAIAISSTFPITPISSYTMSLVENGGACAALMITIAPLINNFTRSMSDSVSYGASRTITVLRISHYLRTMSDSFFNAAGRLIFLLTGSKFNPTSLRPKMVIRPGIRPKIN